MLLISGPSDLLVTNVSHAYNDLDDETGFVLKQCLATGDFSSLSNLMSEKCSNKTTLEVSPSLSNTFYITVVTVNCIHVRLVLILSLWFFRLFVVCSFKGQYLSQNLS